MSAILTAITEVWEAVGTFLVSMFQEVIPIFYVADTGLTFLGVLAIVMSSVSLLLLIWNLIRSFFPMRG